MGGVEVMGIQGLPRVISLAVRSQERVQFVFGGESISFLGISLAK